MQTPAYQAPPRHRHAVGGYAVGPQVPFPPTPFTAAARQKPHSSLSSSTPATLPCSVCHAASSFGSLDPCQHHVCRECLSRTLRGRSHKSPKKKDAKPDLKKAFICLVCCATVYLFRPPLGQAHHTTPRPVPLPASVTPTRIQSSRLGARLEVGIPGAMDWLTVSRPRDESPSAGSHARDVGYSAVRVPSDSSRTSSLPVSHPNMHPSNTRAPSISPSPQTGRLTASPADQRSQSPLHRVASLPLSSSMSSSLPVPMSATQPRPSRLTNRPVVKVEGAPGTVSAQAIEAWVPPGSLAAPSARPISIHFALFPLEPTSFPLPVPSFKRQSCTFLLELASEAALESMCSDSQRIKPLLGHEVTITVIDFADMVAHLYPSTCANMDRGSPMSKPPDEIMQLLQWCSPIPARLATDPAKLFMPLASSILCFPWHILSPEILSRVTEGLQKAFKTLCSRKFRGFHHVSETQHLRLIVAFRRAAETHGPIFAQLQP